MGRKLTTQEFVGRAMTVHGDKYDYSKVEYVGCIDKVEIMCKIHGEFYQSPIKHLIGQGCLECGKIKVSEYRKRLATNARDWNFEQPEDYKLIPLTRGKFAMVDNEDFERLKDINWSLSTDNYATNSKEGFMHRYIMNAPDDMLVDHKEIEETLDNRKSNLRLATKAQNNINTRPNKLGTSIYKGVSWNSRNKKWKAQIAFEGVNRHIGEYLDEREASKAYDRKALELFGEFAYLNFPELREEYLKEIDLNIIDI